MCARSTVEEREERIEKGGAGSGEDGEKSTDQVMDSYVIEKGVDADELYGNDVHEVAGEKATAPGLVGRYASVCSPASKKVVKTESQRTMIR